MNILLSTNGDFTDPILLRSKVPNDGSETITAPNLIGNSNRIMVRGNNHIFMIFQIPILPLQQDLTLF